ncbi:MAG: hypothetical protein ACRC7S_10040, partial [Cetobacterium sp.]
GVNAQEVREMLDDKRKDIPTELCMGSNMVHADYREWMIQNGHSLLEYRSPRWHMQHFGTDYMKGHMGLTNFWVDVVDRRIAWMVKTMPNLEFVVVTDTRSPNEFEWLAHHNADFFMIKRIGFNKDLHDNVENRHPVETHAESWKYDLTIWNQYGYPNDMLERVLAFYGMYR